MNTKELTSCLLIVAPLLAGGGTAPSGRQAPKETLPGAQNYTRVDVTVACGGATSPAEAFPELRRRGFAAVINLRTAAEPDANLQAEAEGARQAGLTYIHIPLTSTAPEPSAVDTFLTAVADRANQPVYIHCGSANRVGAVWLVKRVMLDGWDVERASAEATAIGLTNPTLRAFALSYLKAHGKLR